MIRPIGLKTVQTKGLGHQTINGAVEGVPKTLNMPKDRSNCLPKIRVDRPASQNPPANQLGSTTLGADASDVSMQRKQGSMGCRNEGSKPKLFYPSALS